MLFIDLETAGLAVRRTSRRPGAWPSGAGTYAFLGRLRWFDGRLFRVRQFFLSSFAAERALLEAVAEAAARIAARWSPTTARRSTCRSIDTRFLLHRMETPFAGMPARRHAAPGPASVAQRRR